MQAILEFFLTNDVIWSFFGLDEEFSEVFAEDSEHEQLNTADEKDAYDYGGPSGDKFVGDEFCDESKDGVEKCEE